MKKLKELKHLKSIFVDSINELDTEIELAINKIKEEYQQNVAEERIKLLAQICTDFDLDFNVLKHKYLKNKEVSLISVEPTKTPTTQVEEILLDKITINDTEYYYEKKDNGKVYDIKSNIIGSYVDNKVILN